RAEVDLRPRLQVALFRVEQVDGEAALPAVPFYVVDPHPLSLAVGKVGPRAARQGLLVFVWIDHLDLPDRDLRPQRLDLPRLHVLLARRIADVAVGIQEVTQ